MRPAAALPSPRWQLRRRTTASGGPWAAQVITEIEDEAEAGSVFPVSVFGCADGHDGPLAADLVRQAQEMQAEAMMLVRAPPRTRPG